MHLFELSSIIQCGFFVAENLDMTILVIFKFLYFRNKQQFYKITLVFLTLKINYINLKINVAHFARNVIKRNLLVISRTFFEAESLNIVFTFVLFL